MEMYRYIVLPSLGMVPAAVAHKTGGNSQAEPGFSQALASALGQDQEAEAEPQATSPLWDLGALGGPRLFSEIIAMPAIGVDGASLNQAGHTRPQYGPGQSYYQDPLNSGAAQLPAAISTFQGDRFSQQVELGPAERVGSGVEQFHFAHLEEKDGQYYAYFIDHTQDTLNDVGLALSSDGVNFTYQGKVLSKGESYDALQASFPAVKYDEDTGQWYMLYEGKADQDDLNSVCLAVSQDGRQWQKRGPVISPGDAGELSAVDVGTPTMFKEDGVWHVYFHGLAQDGRVRIGYASGTDLADLTVQQEPALDVDARGREAGTVGARSNVVKVGSYYYMAYETSTAEPQFSQAYWGTNLARASSPDGPWQKLAGGPLLQSGSPGFGLDGPELAVDSGRLYLYYRDQGNATYRREITGLNQGAFGSSLAMEVL